MPASVLIIADRPEIASHVAHCLGSTGCRALVANDVRHAGLILQRETPDVVVLDLATPGHCENVVPWLRRDPLRAGMAIVRVSARTRQNTGSRRELGVEIHVPKPFTPRQIVDAVRTALTRRAARQRAFVPAIRAASTAPAALPRT